MDSQKFFDLKGENTGVSIGRRFVAVFAISLLLYLLFLLTDPLSAYGPKASGALGFFLAVVFFMLFSGVQLSIVAMLVAALGTMLGFFDWSEVTARLGSSAFYQAMGMMIVAMGCEFTPFGNRLGYWLLKHFGHDALKLIIVVTLASTFLSTVISNVAIIILMSSITNKLLLAMGEKPGESKIGQVAMLCIVMGAMTGGMGLFCGSPIGNASVLSYMNSALGADYSPTFAEWAAVSMPTMLLCIVPMIMVYVRWFKLDRKAVISSDRSYYDEQLRALGRMSGAEWRWLIILVCMIVTMFLGVSTAYAAIFFAALSMFPCIGVSDCREVFKRLPWNSLIAICMLPLMSTVIVDNGISDWLGTLLRPLLVDFSPLAFSLVCSVTLAVHINVMVNSMQAAMALVMSIAAPICVSLGYNPTIVLLPTAFASSYMWCFGANQYVMMNKEYGWWRFKDPIIPGFISTLIPAVLAPVIACLVGPIIGLPLYL